jgi:hypothetical protein
LKLLTPNGETRFLDNHVEAIIIPLLLRWCWNWQTGMVEGHVPQGVGVQLPPSAQEEKTYYSIYNDILSPSFSFIVFWHSISSKK